MRIEHNFDDLAEKFDKKFNADDIKDVMNGTRLFFERRAKDIVNTFIGKDGNPQGVDSGNFRDGIQTEVTDSGFGFRGFDTVPYGIYHEFGTKKHWMPFFDESGNLTGLGRWAMRHFDSLGFTVTGKRGKSLKNPSRASREEVLKAKRGIMVSLDEMAPFRTSIDECVGEATRLFKEKLE
jgi:hypothetical protein